MVIVVKIWQIIVTNVIRIPYVGTKIMISGVFITFKNSQISLSDHGHKKFNLSELAQKIYACKY